MTPELKQKWIAALRSGEHAQTTGTLERIDTDGITQGYCCLGVLCKISGLIRSVKRNDYYHLPTYVEYEGSRISPSDKQLAKFGIDKEDAKDLVAMNDGTHGIKHHSFNAIAKHIEEHL